MKNNKIKTLNNPLIVKEENKKRSKIRVKIFTYKQTMNTNISSRYADDRIIFIQGN